MMLKLGRLSIGPDRKMLCQFGGTRFLQRPVAANSSMFANVVAAMFSTASRVKKP